MFIQDSQIKDNLKKYRKLAKLTQTKLAEISGVSLSAIAKLEAANSPNISCRIDTIARLAAVLNVCVDDLLGKKVLSSNPHDLLSPEDGAELASRGIDRGSWNPSSSFSAAEATQKAPKEFHLVYKKATSANDVHNIVFTGNLVVDAKTYAPLGKIHPIKTHGKLVDGDAILSLYRRRMTLLQTDEAAADYRTVEAAISLAPVIIEASGGKN